MVESPTKSALFPKCFHTILAEELSSSDKTVYRASFTTKEELKQWMEEYSTVTRTDWIVKISPTEMEK